jgi:molecular chaperone DnaK
MESQINLPYITESGNGPLAIEASLTRPEFQRMSADLPGRCKSLFQQVIKDATVKAADMVRSRTAW